MSSLKFSEIAWVSNQETYNKIIQHPFNQELMHGILNRDKFLYYIEQDMIYLGEYSKSLALIATKLSDHELIRTFIEFARGAIIAEQEDVHQFFGGNSAKEINGAISLACLGYTSYLLSVSALDSIEVAIAAVVPCFWIYNEVGLYIKQNSSLNNPYQKWIDTYAGEDFSKGVHAILEIVNVYYENANSITKEKMLKAFQNSIIWEYRFWDDSYNSNYFDTV